MSDPVFLLTGASSGIGEATARHAAAAGYRLVLAARSEAKLQTLTRELGGPERALAVRCDVTCWRDQLRLVATAVERFGRLDVAFANAGVGTIRPGFLGDTPDGWETMVRTNVLGVAYTVRAVLPELIQSRGHLLLTGSVAGRRVIAGSLYSCTKFAVAAMGEAVRQDLNGTGARATVIAPGRVATPFFEEPPDEVLEAADVARAVMYAVSQPPHVDVNEILLRPTSQES
jgi:NADP-dependent 3-hydroxy acid dehydrogenase YdfG